MALADRVIWQIEMMLNMPFTLEHLADRCGVSAYHMARSFRAATGYSPMTYLRARRLSVAAGQLATGDRDVLSAALDAHYASHEAFTRAFASYFGVLPRSVRKARSTRNLVLMEPLEMKKELIVDVAAPDIRERAAFRAIGMSAWCSFEDISGIPSLWEAINAREAEVPEAKPGAAYGICCDADGSGRFRYVAGVEAAKGVEVPSGMDDVVVPGGRYAVFTHSGHVSDLPKTVYTIWNKALPDARLEPRPEPDFELYDRRFDPQTGRGTVEIWIPVA